MKSFRGIFIGLGILTLAIALHAQSGSRRAVPPPSSYAVVDRGANHRVWQNETYETTPDGKIRTHTHQYVELASGMHFKDAKGQWMEA